MGVVYAAWDRELDRKVAQKVLHDQFLSRDHQVRLRAEAQAMARIAHPNVVAVYDVGELEQRTCITMEFVAGQSLREWLQVPRGWAAIVKVAAQVARDAAHAG